MKDQNFPALVQRKIRQRARNRAGIPGRGFKLDRQKDRNKHKIQDFTHSPSVSKTKI
jgi:hypothetical protein